MAVTDEAIGKVRQMIASGQLSPGDRLPREPDLAAELGLSRNSLREAVRALSLIHVLDVRQGDGTYVAALEPSVLVEILGFLTDLHQDASVLQFLQVRRILEPAATALAARSMGDADIDALVRLLDELGASPEVEALIASDLEFHRRIGAGSGNAVLAAMIEGVSGPTQRARLWRGLTEGGAVDRTIGEHRAICAALRARDPELAHARATVHVAGVEAWLRQAFAGS